MQPTIAMSECIERGQPSTETHGPVEIVPCRMFHVKKRFSEEHRNMQGYHQAVTHLVACMNQGRAHGGVKPKPTEEGKETYQATDTKGAVVRFFDAKRLFGEYEDISFMMQVMTKDSTELEKLIEEGVYQLGARAVLNGHYIELFTLDLYPK